jgi:hypothetical protein
MISNTASASSKTPEPAQPALNSSKDGSQVTAPAGQAAAPVKPAKAENWAPDWTYDSRTSLQASRTEELYLRYTSKDGDVLEMRSETREETNYSEDIRISGKGRPWANGDAGLDRPGANGLTIAREAHERNEARKAGEAEPDPKEKQLADLRKWAKEVEHELRLQQQRLLEQYLKQSGRHVDSGDGKFLIVYIPGPGEKANAEGSEEEASVPEYWNAENTSDRIVHFATQMAEISGMDPEEFAKTMMKAVGDGFDQANAETGELPGAAGKLNRDTRELVFSKLTKWLEERKGMPYNEGAQSNASSTSEVHDGTENNKQ